MREDGRGTGDGPEGMPKRAGATGRCAVRGARCAVRGARCATRYPTVTLGKSTTLARGALGRYPAGSVCVLDGHVATLRWAAANQCDDVLSPPARGLLEHDSALGHRMATMG